VEPVFVCIMCVFCACVKGYLTVIGCILVLGCIASQRRGLGGVYTIYLEWLLVSEVKVRTGRVVCTVKGPQVV
jgi:hypothetical protein